MYEYSYVCTLARITCDEKEHVMYGMPFQKYTMVRSTWYFVLVRYTWYSGVPRIIHTRIMAVLI